MSLDLTTILGKLFDKYRDYFADSKRRLMFMSELRKIHLATIEGLMSLEEAESAIRQLMDILYGDDVPEEVRQSFTEEIMKFLRYQELTITKTRARKLRQELRF